MHFRARLARLGVIQSMNRPGEVNDNANMESFSHSMKSDVIHGRSLDSHRAADRVLHEYLPFCTGLDFTRHSITHHRWNMRCASTTTGCQINKGRSRAGSYLLARKHLVSAPVTFHARAMSLDQRIRT